MTFRRERFYLEKPVAANYVTPSGVMCVQVQVPDDDEHVALLQGLMANLTNAENWQGTEADRAQLAYLWEAAYVETDWENCQVAATVMQTIDLFCVNATPLAGVGTLTYNASGSLPFGYAISTQNITLYGMEQPVWLAAGEYDYVGWASLSTTGGNTGVALTDGSSVIDWIITSVSQAGAFGTRVKHTGSFTVPDDGFYRVVVGDLGTAGNHTANWISHHISRTGD